MHGFCPHGDLKRRKRAQESDERVQRRGDMRGKGRSGDEREGVGKEEAGKGESRDKRRGGEIWDE